MQIVASIISGSIYFFFALFCGECRIKSAATAVRCACAHACGASVCVCCGVGGGQSGGAQKADQSWCGVPCRIYHPGAGHSWLVVRAPPLLLPKEESTHTHAKFATKEIFVLASGSHLATVLRPT